MSSVLHFWKGIEVGYHMLKGLSYSYKDLGAIDGFATRVVIATTEKVEK